MPRVGCAQHEDAEMSEERMPRDGVAALNSAPVRNESLVIGPGGKWFSFDGAWAWDGKRWRASSTAERRLFGAGPYAVGFGEGRWLPTNVAVISRYAPSIDADSAAPGMQWARVGASSARPAMLRAPAGSTQSRIAGALSHAVAVSVAALLALTVVATLATAGVSVPAMSARAPIAESSDLTEAAILPQAERSVVTVRAENAGGTTVSTGSGFFVSRDGRLLTNAHVVEGAVRVSIITADGQTHPVKKVAIDRSLDVAELAADIPAEPLPMSRSGAVAGQVIYLLGNPGGTSPNTTTKGRIQAAHQTMRTADGHVYPDMIITDANSAPGNSGGPALNSKGEVVGMVTLGDQRSSTGAAIRVERFQPAVAGWAVVTPSPYPKPLPVPVLSGITGSCSGNLCSASVGVANRGADGYVGLRIAFTTAGALAGSCETRVAVRSGSTSTGSCSSQITASRAGPQVMVDASVVDVTAA